MNPLSAPSWKRWPTCHSFFILTSIRLLLSSQMPVTLQFVPYSPSIQRINSIISSPITAKNSSKAESNYRITKRKGLAVLLTIKPFRLFIYVTHFTVVTNHSFLKLMHQKKDFNGRLARCALKRQHQDFTIVHWAGASIIIPTALLSSLAMLFLDLRWSTIWTPYPSQLMAPRAARSPNSSQGYGCLHPD